MADFTELKQKHRATWAAGDYNQIAQGTGGRGPCRAERTHPRR
jgi:hypothetical protein